MQYVIELSDIRQMIDADRLGQYGLSDAVLHYCELMRCRGYDVAELKAIGERMQRGEFCTEWIGDKMYDEKKKLLDKRQS